MNSVDVSVVIVCMNNYNQLRDCLNSIKNNTKKVSYEVILVAYFFSEKNLLKLKEEFSWVKVIISNEIRGFASNNNLALKRAKGKYCFVLNDDTYFTMPVLDRLIEEMEKHNNISLLSPQIISKDGSIQYSGFPPINWIDYIKILYKMKDISEEDGVYVQREGFFRTYHILGAAFMIRMNVFSELGFFDELYFFGPEDKALSAELNKKGYEVWCDTDIKVVHLGGQTGGTQSKTVCATRPANRKGCLIMYSENNWYKRILLALFIWFNSCYMIFYWAIKVIFGNESARNSLFANINVCKTIFKEVTPMNIFLKFYK